MEVELSGIGKRYSREWILRDLDLHISSGEHLAILGGNGSGKSTLLKVIAGYLTASAGTIKHKISGQELALQELYKELSYVAPYQDIYRKLTLKELCRFHFSLRKWREDSNEEKLFENLGLPTEVQINTFSSGMVQRLKLGLALHTQSSLLLFDEPTMNLDDKTTAWFITELSQLTAGNTVVIASNLPGDETSTCSRNFRIES
jgi:ABC-type multidrug transport system ATPase subunit